MSVDSSSLWRFGLSAASRAHSPEQRVILNEERDRNGGRTDDEWIAEVLAPFLLDSAGNDVQRVKEAIKEIA